MLEMHSLIPSHHKHDIAHLHWRTRARLMGFFRRPGWTHRCVDDVMTVSNTTRLFARKVVPVAELSRIASEERR